MTKVINLRKKNKINFKPVYKQNTKKIKTATLNSELYKIMFTCVSIISILIGCMVYRYKSILEISDVCNNLLLNISNESYLEIVFTLLKFDLIYYFIIFFIGTSIIGIPLSFFPIMLKSIFIGYLSSFMYCEFELKGILFCLVLLYPFFVITTTSLIYASTESVYMSRYIYNTLTNKNTADNISIRLYLIRYLFLIGINIACIAINSLLILVLANKFNLQ